MEIESSVRRGRRLASRLKRPVARALGRQSFDESSSYWQERYARGGTSGAGSYGRLAAFKAEVVNDIVREHGSTTVLELGCGDGAQLALASYPSYTGLDVAPSSVDRCRSRFADDATKRFFPYPSGLGDVQPADLTLSLDVIYHLVEDPVFDGYMSDLFGLAKRTVVVYASNVDQAHDAPHVRHRRFTDWVAERAPGWTLTREVPNRFPAAIGQETDDTSFADFYVFERTG